MKDFEKLLQNRLSDKDIEVDIKDKVEAGTSNIEVAIDIEDNQMTGKVITVEAIWIPEKMRNKGIGTEIMETIEEIAKEKDFSAIQLEAFPPGGTDVESVRRLVDWYKELGYEAYEPEELQYFLKNANNENVWYYSAAVNNLELGTSSRTFWMMKELI